MHIVAELGEGSLAALGREEEEVRIEQIGIGRV